MSRSRHSKLKRRNELLDKISHLFPIDKMDKWNEIEDLLYKLKRIPKPKWNYLGTVVFKQCKRAIILSYAKRFFKGRFKKKKKQDGRAKIKPIISISSKSKDDFSEKIDDALKQRDNNIKKNISMTLYEPTTILSDTEEDPLHRK